ncbi:retrovirus-related pol polyprotein from transposon TNT 1-94 [Tanacetum coccineum]
MNECQTCLELKTELLNKKDVVDKETYDKFAVVAILKTLEKHCITLEADSQLNQEIFQQKNSVLDQNAPSFTQLFELSELRAQSQEKDTVIVKLKEQIKSLKGNVDDSKVKIDMDKIETLNIELEHRVTKLVAENEHLKQTYKQLYDSIKPKRVQSKEQCDEIPRNMIILINGNDCMSSDNLCVSNSMNDVKFRAKPKKEIWKPTGKVFTKMGYIWRPTGQFCDSNLKVAFRQHTCSIRNLEGVDLLTGSGGDNLYTLSLRNMMASSPICLLSKASKTKSWLWHRRLSHLNFGAINHLARHGLVRGLPKLKFEKDHLCSACALGKSSKKPHKPKSEDTNQEKLYLLHMDLCGPMRVASVNGKKYILVIVDDYSRFTWVKCLRSKDEAPAFIINFLKMIQVRLKETVRRIRTDNGTEFVNQTLREYYEKVGISHETSVARSPQQNGVVERRNHMLIEAARTMLIYAKAPLFSMGEAVAIHSFADVDHAGCQDTRRSTSGSIQLLGDRLVSWSSKRQKSVAISSTEAEYIALSKHIDIRFHFIKEHVENGVIELYFVNTEYQLADIFTKALSRERIEFLINKLGMRSFTPETLKKLADDVDE